MIQLSIIIVNYKSAQLVCDCLYSVYGQNATFNFEIIVVDNDSADGSKEKITALYPEIKWIQMGYNSGFARANNEGIRKSNGDIVLLLNSDTIIENNAIELCYNHFVIFQLCRVWSAIIKRRQNTANLWELRHERRPQLFITLTFFR